MRQADFVKWLAKTRVKWSLVNGQYLRCDKGLCPLQVLTHSRENYPDLAHKKHGLSSKAIQNIMWAADDAYLLVNPAKGRLRTQMLKAARVEV